MTDVGTEKYEPATLAEVKEGRETNITTLRAAVAWHLNGADWATIAERFSFSSPQAARTAVETFEGEMVESTDIAAARNKALARYERLLSSVWPDAIMPFKVDGEGKPTEKRNDAHGSAFDRARSIIGDIARLTGSNAPAQLALYVPGQDEILALVTELRELQTAGEAREADIFDAEIVDDDEDDPDGS